MNSPASVAELVVDHRGGLQRHAAEAIRTLERVFQTILCRVPIIEAPSGVEQIPRSPEAVAERVARALLSLSRDRADSSVTTLLPGIQTRLLAFVRRGISIEAQMLWSPKKHWTLGTESAVDLAELFALQTLVSIDSAVRTVYRPGMSYFIDVEDIEFEFMEGQSEEVANAQQIYIGGIKRLLLVLGLGELFTLRIMSKRAKDGQQLGQWRQQMLHNYRALQAYWSESQACPVSSWEMLPSLKEIHRLGWKGTIPPEMRRYYLNRLGKITDASEAQKVDMVLRNLAGILLHYQAGLLRGSGELDPVKLSFVRAANGVPAKLLEGRVDIRFAPRKLCSRVNAAAPWSTKGFLCQRNNKVRVSFRGWRELAAGGCRFTEGWYTIAGDSGAARVRADLISENEG